MTISLCSYLNSDKVVSNKFCTCHNCFTFAACGKILMICWPVVELQQFELGSGGWFNIKKPSYQYRKSHCGDKTVVRSSYLHNRISYTGKMTSLYWIRAQHIVSEFDDSCSDSYFARSKLSGKSSWRTDLIPNPVQSYRVGYLGHGQSCFGGSWLQSPFVPSNRWLDLFTSSDTPPTINGLRNLGLRVGRGFSVFHLHWNLAQRSSTAGLCCAGYVFAHGEYDSMFKKMISYLPPMHKTHLVHFIGGQFWPSGIVVACVCLPVRVSVTNLSAR